MAKTQGSDWLPGEAEHDELKLIMLCRRPYGKTKESHDPAPPSKMSTARWVQNLNKFCSHIFEDPENFPLVVVTGGTVVYFFACMARRYVVVKQDLLVSETVDPMELHKNSIKQVVPYLHKSPTVVSDKTIKEQSANPSPSLVIPTPSRR